MGRRQICVCVSIDMLKFYWWLSLNGLHIFVYWIPIPVNLSTVYAMIHFTVHTEVIYYYYSVALIWQPDERIVLSSITCSSYSTKWRHQHTFRPNWWCKINKTHKVCTCFVVFPFSLSLLSKTTKTSILLCVGNSFGFDSYIYFLCSQKTHITSTVIFTIPFIVTLCTPNFTKSLPFQWNLRRWIFYWIE